MLLHPCQCSVTQAESDCRSLSFSLLAENYLLADDDWKTDIMPEILDGKNVADFIDPDIAEKLEALEREEERLEAEGFYKSDEEEIVRRPCCLDCHRPLHLLISHRPCFLPSQIDSDEEEFRATADAIREKKASMKKVSQDRNKLANRPIIPRKHQTRTLSQLSTTLRSVGLDPSRIEERAKQLAKAQGLGIVDGVRAKGDAIPGERQGKRSKRSRMEAEAQLAMEAAEAEQDDDDMSVDGEEQQRGGAVGAAHIRAPKTDRSTAGLTKAQYDKSNELRNFAQRPRNYKGKASEADRHIGVTRPKWLLAGKRKAGKTDFR